MTNQAPVIGRYAPSPTGALHLGNLRTALLAWLSARLQGGKFIVRMEDIDQPRVVTGSADQILRDLEWLGLDWDGPVVYQSQRTDLYQSALDQLSRSGLIYPCFCSRKDIQATILNLGSAHATSVYPGTCSSLSNDEVALKLQKKSPALRLRVPENSQVDIGDFVVKRSDSLFAYQLVVTVDDLDQGVSEVLRGADLIDSTPKQQLLATMLSSYDQAIEYLHAPLMLEPGGDKMSKRDGSYSLRDWKSRGGTASELIAYLSRSIGLLDQVEPLAAQTLLTCVERAQINRLLS